MYFTLFLLNRSFAFRLSFFLSLSEKSDFSTQSFLPTWWLSKRLPFAHEQWSWNCRRNPPTAWQPQVICMTISAGRTNLVACWNLGSNCLGQALFSFLIPSAKQWWLTLIIQIPNSDRKWALVFPTRSEMQLSCYFSFPEVSLFFFCLQESALCSVITHL